MFVDAHCDTISELLDKGGDLNRNNLHFDLERFAKIGGGLQFFAAFVAPEYANMRRAVEIIDKFYILKHLFYYLRSLDLFK